MKAVEITEFGDSDVIETTEREVPEPGDGEVRVAVEAAGINFADIMQRRGHYVGGPEPPYVPGMEAAGTIDAVGDGVDREVGERVVAMTDEGYAEYTTADAAGLFDIPESMSFPEAAGFPVQFLTAHNTLFEWGGLEEDERVLIHAAAGGVGTAATQLASEAGAEVFGTASTQEKLDLAERLGLDHPINYTETEFAEAVNDATDGEGVDLVLDGIGGDTTTDSLDCLTHFGRMVSYGAASGEPGYPDTSTLLFNNFTIQGYHLGQSMQRAPERVLDAVPHLTELLTNGELEVVVGETFPLAEAADAHEYIENRKSSGKVVLEP
ncbi:zn-dependent oxidoreductase, NADph:quinone reductase [Halococcus morrhuae DSM 1307]|uniref:Zn-dependent oxidoreductase, NADph:quinone reductase n=1 Tax=Halococcus morrhuae DSM 1307 TaxID=931277 RepID=M0MT64_HALMO|nr:NADPH:quinone oxidoreductase family protein [Halococcus morrhuae]EMA47660.1 zn-dependent oxidoreductase, NADph:quinone reductase [Halococcus morrhuae DSM 1307]